MRWSIRSLRRLSRLSAWFNEGLASLYEQWPGVPRPHLGPHQLAFGGSARSDPTKAQAEPKPDPAKDPAPKPAAKPAPASLGGPAAKPARCRNWKAAWRMRSRRRRKSCRPSRRFAAPRRMDSTSGIRAPITPRLDICATTSNSAACYGSTTASSAATCRTIPAAMNLEVRVGIKSEDEMAKFQEAWKAWVMKLQYP